MSWLLVLSRCSSHPGPSSYSTWHDQCEELSPYTSPGSMCPPYPPSIGTFLSLASQTSETKQKPQNQTTTTTTTNPRNLVPTSPEATSALLPLLAKLLSHRYQCPLYRGAFDVPLHAPLLCSPGPRPPLVCFPALFSLVLSFADFLFQGPLVWKTPFLSHLPMVLLLLTPLRF